MKFYFDPSRRGRAPRVYVPANNHQSGLNLEIPKPLRRPEQQQRRLRIIPLGQRPAGVITTRRGPRDPSQKTPQYPFGPPLDRSILTGGSRASTPMPMPGHAGRHGPFVALAPLDSESRVRSSMMMDRQNTISRDGRSPSDQSIDGFSPLHPNSINPSQSPTGRQLRVGRSAPRASPAQPRPAQPWRRARS